MTKRTIAVLLCLLTTTLVASGGPPVPVETRAKGAQLIVVATVENVSSRFGANAYGDQVILSDLQLDVAETWKGQSSLIMTVTIEGGHLGDLALQVSDMPVMRTGERAVFFLDRAGNGLILHGRGLGVLKVDASDRLPEANQTLDDVRRAVRAALR